MESEAKKTSCSQIGPEEQFLIRRVIRKIAVLGAQIFIENLSRIILVGCPLSWAWPFGLAEGPLGTLVGAHWALLTTVFVLGNCARGAFGPVQFSFA